MSNTKRFSSRKEVTEFLKEKEIDTSNWSEEKWLSLNKGQAEIHIQALAEAIWDAMNESTPNQLKAGEWHIPYYSTMEIPALQDVFANANPSINIEMSIEKYIEQIEILAVKVSTAMAARESYTVVGNEKDINYQKQLELHDRLISQDPPHSSPFEHCARVMTPYEYETFIKGVGVAYMGEEGIRFEDYSAHGWCANIKGFISYRYIIDNNLEM